jgi:hypothetical protein
MIPFLEGNNDTEAKPTLDFQMQVEQKFQCWVACTFPCLSLCVGGNTKFFVKVVMYVCMHILHFHQIPIGDYRSLLGIM